MKILCFGDSNTFGYNPIDGSRYPANIRWSGILKEELNTKAKIVEAGCNNRTCVANNPAGELFCGTKIFPKILNQDFSHIIIGLGINDLQKIYDIKTNDLENGLEQLIKTAKEKIPSAEIILLSPNEITENILNSNFNVLFDESSIEKSKGIFKIYENLAKKYNCKLIDLNKIATVSNIDGLHYYPKDHRLIADAILNILKI